MRDRADVIAQLLRFLWDQRAWWLAPVIIGLIIIGGLAVLGAASPLAPLMYPLF